MIWNEITERRVGEVTVLDLQGTTSTVQEDSVLCEAVKRLIAQGSSKLLFNLERVHYIDSMGLGDIISSYTLVCRAGGQLKLFNVVPAIHGFLEHAGLLAVFEVYQSEDQAASSFGPL